ncbi:sensor histidine kinase [Streptomyces sp. NPDC059637]|uniref:sensor histidine kinase n=1 Tax=Streptomyces sp. NPDC059637 TaxID=3347752 RepID=UPI00368F1231
MNTPNAEGGPRTPARRPYALVRDLARSLARPSPDTAPLLSGASAPWQRVLPYVVAVALVASLLPTTVAVLGDGHDVGGGVAGMLATAQTAPLLLAVARPLQAWWIAAPAHLAGAVVCLLSSDSTSAWPWTPPGVIGYLALLTALSLRERARTLTAVWLTTGVAGFGLDLVAPERSGASTSVLVFVLGGAVLLLGGALRERGEARRRLTEQVGISEAERARRTLLEERTRIARELHDVVAHHMSVITVRADSAPYRIEGLPEEALEEFTAIGASARESLTEMRRLLGVLRSEDNGGERTPQPGVDRLFPLVDAVSRAGVPTTLSFEGAQVRGLPPAVDLSAYRIVQEALANVVRHAPGARALVTVGLASRGPAGERELRIEVVNDAAGAPGEPLEPRAEGTGHGLVGMRERVRLLGGTLQTGPTPEGGFRVAAVLPLAAHPGTDGAGGAGGTEKGAGEGAGREDVSTS